MSKKSKIILSHIKRLLQTIGVLLIIIVIFLIMIIAISLG
jgi:hypothetical protein